MIRGFYSSASAMMSHITQQDVIANNLANVNTAGFKRTETGFSSFNSQLQAANSTTPKLVIPFAVTHQDQQQGQIQDTGSPANLAINGQGYFVVQTANGDQLMRGGNFQLDDAGRLVTTNGEPVLGERGPIQVPSSDFSVGSDGTVRSGNTVIDKLRIESSLGTAASTPVTISSGRLETSNVNTVQEMVSMITAMRSYEACQKTILALDQTLDKAINQMGKGI